MNEIDRLKELDRAARSETSGSQAAPPMDVTAWVLRDIRLRQAFRPEDRTWWLMAAAGAAAAAAVVILAAQAWSGLNDPLGGVFLDPLAMVMQ